MRFKRYGLGEDDYQSMCDEQESRCAMCDQLHDDFDLVIDHDHALEDYDVWASVRGLLCSDCNYHLGILEGGDSVPDRGMYWRFRAKGYLALVAGSLRLDPGTRLKLGVARALRSEACALHEYARQYELYWWYFEGEQGWDPPIGVTCLCGIGGVIQPYHTPARSYRVIRHGRDGHYTTIKTMVRPIKIYWDEDRDTRIVGVISYLERFAPFVLNRIEWMHERKGNLFVGLTDQQSPTVVVQKWVDAATLAIGDPWELTIEHGEFSGPVSAHKVPSGVRRTFVEYADMES